MRFPSRATHYLCRKPAVWFLLALLGAIQESAVLRVRPKAMTVAVVLVGLIPIMWSHGTGSEVMQHIARFPTQRSTWGFVMKHKFVLAFTLTLATSPVAFAATPMDGMEMKPAAQAAQPTQAPKPVAAEVRKVYPDTGKVTLKHGAIDNLNMGAMTMTFAVRDKAVLKNVKEGDKVSAVFDTVNGQPTVVEMRRQ